MEESLVIPHLSYNSKKKKLQERKKQEKIQIQDYPRKKENEMLRKAIVADPYMYKILKMGAWTHLFSKLNKCRIQKERTALEVILTNPLTS